jgi:PAS domain S-box-containing protein
VNRISAWLGGGAFAWRKRRRRAGERDADRTGSRRGPAGLAGPAGAEGSIGLAGTGGEAGWAGACGAAGDGLAILGPDGRMVGWNAALGDLCGFSGEALAGLDLAALFHADDRGTALARLEALAASPADRQESHLRALRPDGQVVPVRCLLTAQRDPSGRLVQAVALLADASERQALVARLEVAERRAALGTLAASVANEIANPMAYLVGNLGFAREALAAGAATRPEALAHARQALDEAHEGAARVTRIVGDLTALAREGPERREPIDVPAALRSALGLAAGFLQSRARLLVDLAPLPPVTGDPVALGQAFLDLLVEAGQSIPEGQPEANQVAVVAAMSADGRVRVEVNDTGTGREGIGLAHCRKVVESLEGELTLRVEGGAPRSAVVLLPPAAAAARPLARPAATPVPAVARRARILVVDDEPFVGRTLRRILGASHDVEVAGSAREALERLGQAPAPEVILCDLHMPGMTGMDLHAALAGRDPGLAARMIFITGGALHASTRGFLESVGNPVLEKPFATERLVRLIEETARLGAAASPAPAQPR